MKKTPKPSADLSSPPDRPAGEKPSQRATVWSGVLSFGLLLPLVPLLVGLIPVAYHALQVGGHHHATFGMRVFDLEVKTWTGGQPDVWQGFLMAALFYATLAITCSLILLVAVFNDRRRTLHDYLAGVVVVRRALGAHLITPPMPAM